MNQFKVFGGILVFVIAGIAATSAPKPAHKNLKVLPKDISDRKLDSLMQGYNKALAVTCDFCHAAHKDIPDSLDYASDEKPMKEEGRKMIRLTLQINKDYFYTDKSIKPEDIKTVSCNTCHRGDPFPADL
jgi:hypothetical protein